MDDCKVCFSEVLELNFYAMRFAGNVSCTLRIVYNFSDPTLWYFTLILYDESDYYLFNNLNILR